MSPPDQTRPLDSVHPGIEADSRRWPWMPLALYTIKDSSHLRDLRDPSICLGMADAAQHRLLASPPCGKGMESTSRRARWEGRHPSRRRAFNRDPAGGSADDPDRHAHFSIGIAWSRDRRGRDAGRAETGIGYLFVLGNEWNKPLDSPTSIIGHPPDRGCRHACSTRCWRAFTRMVTFPE